MKGYYSYLVGAVWTATAVARPGALGSNVPSTCRYLPGDAGWPSADKWAALNDTVGGQLIATKLLGQPCHGSTYDEAECAIVKDNWTWPEIHWQDPASVQNPYWQNDTCSPFTSKDTPCTFGNIATYSINLTGASDALAGLKFAQDNNIRLSIKNTGHDFLGRSSGHGALNLWTHHLKEITIMDYQNANYTGKAMRMGAGVQAFEAYAAADKAGLQVVGGSCPTVGLAGGYTSGAGHGPLNAAYGLAADNVLEWEVVTATGEHLIATPANNTDLYFALSGGGPGTYGVVISMTIKAHPDGPVAGATLQFNSTNITSDAFWTAVDRFNEITPSLLDQPGFHFVYTLINTTFYLNFATWPNHTANEIQALLQPYTAFLDTQEIPYDHEYSDDKGFHPHYARYTPNLPYGSYGVSELLGGRIIPVSTVEDNNAGLTAALRNITLDSRWVMNAVASNLSTSRFPSLDPKINSVLPAWRSSVFFINLVVLWDPEAPVSEGVKSENEMTYEIVPQLENITPGSGTYINEGDFNNPNWKWDYFGENYDRLLAIKKTYDPNDLFYAIASVGNDVWSVQSDGRLCRA